MPTADPLDSATRARIDAAVEDAVSQGDVPGVVAAVARGPSIHVATAGLATIGGPAMQRDTLFRIASITKPVTAATVLALADDGLLDLDAPIDAVLPELADRRVLMSPDGPLDQTTPALRAVTTRDLLTFTWGFGMEGAMFMAPEPWPIVSATVDRHLNTFGPPAPDDTPDPDTWMRHLGELPLLAQPGERWLYQSGAQVLGVLASRVSGMDFGEVMRQRVLDPLGMNDTAFVARDVSRLATAYERRDGELVVADAPDGQWSRPPRFPDGGAGLVSTVDDLIAFGRMLLRGGAGVLLPETVAAMTRDQLTPAQREHVWPGFSFLEGRGWGYGVSVLEDGRYTWDGGSGTSWSNVPSQDLIVVVLTQRAFDESGPPEVCSRVLDAARAF